MGVTDSATTAIMTLLFVGTSVMLYGAILKLWPADLETEREGGVCVCVGGCGEKGPEEAKSKNFTPRDPDKKWEKLMHAEQGK